ncbi:hypothetical protein BJP40_09580 [Streptomyces sp. CC53]|uniref:hypothetical protein n=1 Tax=unclassified Streptomyces TaxID=2593676 RepID=UPI0008DDA9B6|nr:MULTISPECIES: hypothetical protein [unclassified Streptomyces]OII60568.1 hypothetical protein BJP40_09580 [Streptomyces sp. CC53]
MKRRALPAAAALVSLVVWLLAAAPTAFAHGGGLRVDITGHAFGRVEATVTWADDGDPVDEAVAATVNAVSPDGTAALGPWKLVRDPADPKRYTTAEALPPGTWRVTIAIGYPALGKGERQLTVSPGTPASPSPGPDRGTAPPPGPGNPSAGPTAADAPPGSPPAQTGTAPGVAPSGAARDAGHAEPGNRGFPTGLAVGAALAAAAAAAAVVVVRRRRG